MENDQSRINGIPWYQKIYGGTQISRSGPLFFLIVGIISYVIYLPLISLKGGFYSGLLASDSSLRPDVSFPVFNILLFCLIISAVVGIVLGILGIIWYQLYVLRRVFEENE